MVMPRLRWPILAVLGLALVPTPAPLTERVARSGLIPDPTFQVPDSVRAMLTGVTRLVVAPDSSVYLADWQIPAILQLEPSGKFRGVLGRSGGGPGEFQQVFTLGLYRDSLWAMDPAQIRVTLMPLAGGGVSTARFGPYAPKSTAPGAYSRRGLPTSVLPDGTFLLEEGVPDPSKPTHGLLLRVDRTMRVIDTIAELNAKHSRMTFTYSDGGEVIPQPWSDDPTYGVSVDGSMVVLVSRRAASNEDEGSFTVVGLKNGKEQLFNRTVSYTPRRLLTRSVDSVVVLMASDESAGIPTNLVTADSVRRKIFRPAFYPPVSEVRVGRDGSVWLKVRFADSPAKGDEWMQLSARGLPVRRVVTPTGFRLLEADRNMVWGTFADSLDVPQVRRYSLDRPVSSN